MILCPNQEKNNFYKSQLNNKYDSLVSLPLRIIITKVNFQFHSKKAINTTKHGKKLVVFVLKNHFFYTLNIK